MKVTLNLKKFESKEFSFIHDILLAHFIEFTIEKDVCDEDDNPCILHFSDKEDQGGGLDIANNYSGFIDSKKEVHIFMEDDMKCKNIYNRKDVLAVVFAHYVLKNKGKCEHCTSNLHAEMYPFDK